MAALCLYRGYIMRTDDESMHDSSARRSREGTRSGGRRTGTARRSDGGRTSEIDVMREIQLAPEVQQLAVLWRNHVGTVVGRDGRVHTFGLGKGSPDLVGFLRGSGRFVGIEVKALDGRLSPCQKQWAERATELGALVGVARSVAEAVAILRRET